MSTYAGIGSRQTPPGALRGLERLAKELSEEGHILRTGGAPGADTAFANGAWPNAEIYLPWSGFNGHADADAELTDPMEEAFLIAKFHHPAWERLSHASKKLHARNTHIILGRDLQEPVEFVICWTPGARKQGGTAQGIRIAEDSSIPVINFGRWGWSGS